MSAHTHTHTSCLACGLLQLRVGRATEKGQSEEHEAALQEARQEAAQAKAAASAAAADAASAREAAQQEACRHAAEKQQFQDQLAELEEVDFHTPAVTSPALSCLWLQAAYMVPRYCKPIWQDQCLSLFRLCVVWPEVRALDGWRNCNSLHCLPLGFSNTHPTCI